MKTEKDPVNSVIYGTLLGDACIGKDKTSYRLTVSHGIKQIKYLQWKADILGYKRPFRDYISGYGVHTKRIDYFDVARLATIYDTCIVGGKKSVTPEWIAQLDVISLAVWYQDDGSWGRVGAKSKTGGRYQRRASFSACSFNAQDCALLIEWLSTYGLKGRYVIRKGKYPMIELNHRSTLLLWQQVAPYTVLTHKLDLSQKSWSKEPWVDAKLVGGMAKRLTNMPPPTRQKLMRYNMNSRVLRWITCGNETRHLNDWARVTGIKRETITQRLRRGWPVERALTLAGEL